MLKIADCFANKRLSLTGYNLLNTLKSIFIIIQKAIVC